MSTAIVSPLPGIFYRRPSPDEPNFKDDGASVAEGDVIGLVEVMKSFHQVKAAASGENIRFLVESEMPISPGQPLAEID